MFESGEAAVYLSEYLVLVRNSKSSAVSGVHESIRKNHFLFDKALISIEYAARGNMADSWLVPARERNQKHFRGLPGINYRLLVHIRNSQLRFLPGIYPSVLRELLSSENIDEYPDQPINRWDVRIQQKMSTYRNISSTCVTRRINGNRNVDEYNRKNHFLVDKALISTTQREEKI